MESSEDIKRQVNELIAFCIKKENTAHRRNNMDEYKQVCMRTYTDFHQKYPTLFFSIIENPTTFPLYRLEEMLSLKRKIETYEISEKNASVHLGNKYFNEFVKDTVSNLDKELENKKSKK